MTVLKNQVEYDLWDAVSPILKGVVSEADFRSCAEDAECGYPAGGVSGLLWTLYEDGTPVPESAIQVIESFEQRLYDYNTDWFGVVGAMVDSVKKNGTDSFK